jgi:hypothetical protein
MDRAELEKLDRDTLISRAEEMGVVRANVLTRPELVDEILLRDADKIGDKAQVARARGWFGRARDLLAEVVEKGLHLPDAADKIRARTQARSSRSVPAAVPTVTLAEIYATQGHKEKALDTLRRVLDQEPEHAAARSLLNQLEKTQLPPPQLPPEDDASADGPAPSPAASDSDRTAEGGEEAPEPFGMLDDKPLPPRYDVDECVAIPVDPKTMFVYWEVREETLAHLRKVRPGGHVALRVLIIEPTWDGPRTHVRDHSVYSTLGEWFIRHLPLGCVVRAGLGWRDGEAFVAVAHSPALEVPPGTPSPILGETLVRWTPKGVYRVEAGEVGTVAIEHALDRVQVHTRAAAAARVATGGISTVLSDYEEPEMEDEHLPLGASERLARPRPGGARGAGVGPGGRFESSSESMLDRT